MQKLSPIEDTQRIEIIDIIKGISLLGLFLSNLRSLSLYDPEQHGRFFSNLDDSIGFLLNLLVEGKFQAIFCLLFGWGVSTKMSKVRSDGFSGSKFLKKRLWLLFILGLMISIFLWSGDSIFILALIGFFALAFQYISNRKILIWSILLLILPVLLYMMKMVWAPMNYFSFLFDDFGDAIQMNWAHLEPGSHVLQTKLAGSFGGYVRYNIGGIFYHISDFFFTSGVSKFLGMFILGFMLGRGSYFKKLIESPVRLMKITAIGYCLGLFFNALMARYIDNVHQYYYLRISGLYQTIAAALGIAPLAVAYMTSLAVLNETKGVNNVLRIFGPSGQMLLTNFILQTLIAMFVFQGFGAAWGGQFGPVAWSIFAVIVFIFQVAFSWIWLKKFHYGPAEWVWRSIVYNKSIPFLRKEEPEGLNAEDAVS